MKEISIVVPCYNEQETIPYFYKEICGIFTQIPNTKFEIIFVDDGSQDHTLEIIKEISKLDNRFKYISFSRNFGKESAIYAGLSEAHGDYIGIMDVDLQDPPSLIKTMFEILETKEYDCVATRRINRTSEPPIRSFFARLFYKIINKVSDANIVDGARDFRLMSKQMVQAILSVSEYSRFSKGIFGWVGFKTKWIEYENLQRISGTTKFSFWSLFLYAINGITAFSTVPLAISYILGILFITISSLILFKIIYNLIFYTYTCNSFYIICVIFLVSGIQLLCTGILGSYLAKTYLEVKKRPIYIIKEKSLK